MGVSPEVLVKTSSSGDAASKVLLKAALVCVSVHRGFFNWWGGIESDISKGKMKKKRGEM